MIISFRDCGESWSDVWETLKGNSRSYLEKLFERLSGLTLLNTIKS